MCPHKKGFAVYFQALLFLLLFAGGKPAWAQRAKEMPAEKSEAKMPPKEEEKKEEKEKEEEERTMRFRTIGPYRGGRSLTAAGIPGNPKVYYFGATGGGLWKSTDGALTWKPIFDKQGTSSIGSIAVSESDPNVLYVGTGEACIRGNISHGDGVYKSLDGGKTWKNVGLRDSRTIGRVIVHPRDPNIVFVAALGHAFGPNAERGIFRTTDGGKTWEKVLFKDENTGGIDISFDPNNPNILLAALWQARRTAWSLSSGGPGSGLYRSTDGGNTWKQLTEHGLPKGPWGRIGVAVAANSDRVFALIEAQEGGLYRSEDGGGKWERINDDRRFQQRAWYYMHVIADPRDANTLYILNVDFHKSTDGGHTFNKIEVPHGDNHGLWIDPKDTERMIASNDGGATVTFDGGKHWTSQNNQPTAQFYHVITDYRFPYYVYGAQQDNSTIAIASRGESGFIDRAEWYPVGGGEAGYIAPYPPDPNVVFAGEYQGQITRYDKRNWDRKPISIFPELTDAMGAANLEHRFQWTAPIVISPHDPNVLYHGGERLFKTSDAGAHWEAISPDLTRNDKSKQQPSGGSITVDDTGTEYYDTIFTIAESPLQKGLIWAGTDDGLIHLTRDAGKSWNNVTPKEMPEWSRISLIEASPHDPATAYFTADRHQFDDLLPYIYKTHDYGKTWVKITANIPDVTFARAVREDPKRKGLLYAGTETGVFISYDDGAHWRSLQLNLPTTPVHDLVIHEDDLVLATHGRSFWILDDVGPLRQYVPENEQEEAHIYAPSPAWRVHSAGGRRKPDNVGENPPRGAVIYFHLKSLPKGERSEVTLEILDSKGERVRRLSSTEFQELDEPLDPDDQKAKKKLELTRGLNRAIWDLRYEGAPRIPGYYLFEYQAGTHGPMALPGHYQVKLTVEGKSYTAPLELKPDPRSHASMADLEKQFDLLIEVREELTRLYKAVTQMHDLRDQARLLHKRLMADAAAKPVAVAAGDLDRKIAVVQEALVQEKIKANEDSLNFPPALDSKLSVLADYVGGNTDSAPTEAAYRTFERLKRETDQQLASWTTILSTDVVALQKLAEEHKVGLLLPPAPSDTGRGAGK